MSWQATAGCREENPEIFYPHAQDYHAATKAVAICKKCPVIDECAQKADELERDSTSTRDLWGIWGGETPIDRAIRRGHLAKPPADPNRYNYASNQPCWGCNRPMRPKYARIETPGTVRYEGQGLCNTCFKTLAVPRCSHCREMMRPVGTRPETFPVAKDPAGGGLCQECVSLRQPDGRFLCRACKRTLHTYGGKGYHIRCRPGQKKTQPNPPTRATNQTVKTRKDTKKNTTTTKEPDALNQLDQIRQLIDPTKAIPGSTAHKILQILDEETTKTNQPERKQS